MNEKETRGKNMKKIRETDTTDKIGDRRGLELRNQKTKDKKQEIRDR